MKIAFDVKGTLDSDRYGVAIRYAFYNLLKAGHELTVWSNCSLYPKKIIDKYNLTCDGEFKINLMTKKSKYDCEDLSEWFDVCVEDDTSQTYLAAKVIIYVNELNCNNGIDLIEKILSSGMSI